MQKGQEAANRAAMIAALQSVHDYVANQAAALGVSVAELCRMADVERSHFQRWKNSTPRTLETVTKLFKALDTVEAGLGVDIATPADVETT